MWGPLQLRPLHCPCLFRSGGGSRPYFQKALGAGLPPRQSWIHGIRHHSPPALMDQAPGARRGLCGAGQVPVPWVWAFLARGSARVKDGASSRLGRCKRKWDSASRGWSPAALRAPLGFTTCQRHALARDGGWGGVPLCSGVCVWGGPKRCPKLVPSFHSFQVSGERAAPSEAAFSEHPAWVSSAGTIPSLRLAFCSSRSLLASCVWAAPFTKAPLGGRGSVRLAPAGSPEPKTALPTEALWRRKSAL